MKNTLTSLEFSSGITPNRATPEKELATDISLSPAKMGGVTPLIDG